MVDLRKDVVEICEQSLATRGSSDGEVGVGGGVESAPEGTDAARIRE